MNVGELSPALREVLWSTAVQHGPAGAENIFSDVLRGLIALKPTNFDQACIEAVYLERRQYFRYSSSRIRKAVLGRLSHERRLALAMLDGHAG